MTTQSVPCTHRVAYGAAALAMLLALQVGPAAAQTLRVVMQSGLRILDPVVTTGYITRDHGYMIYDTLLGMDADFNIRPQMADWTVSDDNLTYTFTLRDGLLWHDSTPVTAQDCIASIRRWAEVDGTGVPLMQFIASIDAIDAKTFQITLNEPTGLLLAGLARLSSRPVFMMPARVANTPASQPITDTTGSGPFRFVTEDYQPGLRVVYARNDAYVPRDEPPSWTAGGKVVNVDRVEWQAIPDQMTAVNALINDEVDYIQQVPFDLLPLLDGNPDITVDALDRMGTWTYFRMNHLQPPFDNPLLRRAAMAAVSQTDILQAAVGNPDLFSTCAAVMGCGTPNGDEYGRDWLIEGNIDMARALLAEAGYDGAPVVILQPTDLAIVATQPIVIADALRRAGFTVDLRTMDWQTLQSQLRNQAPTLDGGWSLYSSAATLATSGDPFGNPNLATAGLRSTTGWPDVPEIEARRTAYARAVTPAAQRDIARQIQRLAIDNGVVAPLGQFHIPTAYRNSYSGFLPAPVTLFWNVAKTGG
ncbi:ABC transporter substrate-binding protein [Ketogulonicigenium robustum]|uniref:ABC transporter substrate-binding protein n=1 Tax=Ketogulonicigenium robustum TaxID=92947 RepID=A0A1W6NX97_9RHOB|nr:ABC transporter substrate-binding protein [Ketogulonicigenium robustum]ARO13809.1 ABC transporter substrate-binding protein [Ketogulonicigenium robustum]